MARRDTRRQIRKERRGFGVDRQTAVSITHARQILIACLLDNRETRAQRSDQRLDRGGHHIGHDPRTLAAAENKEPEPIGHRRIRRGSGGDDRGPYWITVSVALAASRG